MGHVKRKMCVCVCVCVREQARNTQANSKEKTQ